MRKLVSIQKIIEINPIEGADKIVHAKVLGWNVVILKNEFKVGDLCCFFEIDSLLPPTPEFGFLAKGNSLKKSYINGKEYQGYRLKTIKLRGIISQGLCLPLSILKDKKYPTDKREKPIIYNFKEGDDVSNLLGVVKYEPFIPACLSGVAVGLFPSFIPKTDEPRIQAMPEILDKYKNIPFYITEKVDGTSMTVFMKNDIFHVCSRSIDLKESDENTYWQVARQMKLENILRKTEQAYAIQGEVIGDNIQGNKLKINGHTCQFFNVYNMIQQRYLDYEEFISFCKDNGLPMVQHVGIIEKLPLMIDELVTMATRKSKTNPDIWVEGIVMRPLHETRDEKLGRLSFKIINPQFLLEYGE